MANRKRRSTILRESQAPTPLVEREFSADQRKAAAESGAALDDGSYPIKTKADLKNAISAYGRAKDKAAAKTHIIKRAKALGATDELPADWQTSVTEAAVEISLEDLVAKINGLICQPQQPSMPAASIIPADDPGDAACWPYVVSTYSDHVIVRRGDDLYQLAYVVDDMGEVTLGTPIEVAVSYQPVAETSTRPAPAQPGADPAEPGAPVELSESDGRFLADVSEATAAKGNAWDVLLIKAGTSGNARHYPASVLESAVPLFEGARAYADHPTRDEQRNRPERSIRDVVGWFESVYWDAAEQGIRGTFRILESADWLRTALKSAWDQGKKDLLGFSINALGRVGSKRADNSTLIEAIEKVVSTDVVTTPGAGGRLLGVLESERNTGAGLEGEMDPEEIKRLIQEALASSTAGLMEAMRTEIGTAVATLRPTGTEGAGATAVVTESATPDPIQEALREIREAQASMTRERRAAEISTRVDAAKLPTAHALRIKTRLLEAVARRGVDDAEVDGEITYARELIAESGPARVSWAGMTVQAGDSAHDKFVKGLQGWFEGAAVDGVPAVRDLRESYALWTGSSYLDADPFQMWNAFRGGYDSGANHKAIRESLGTSDWGQVFADVFYLQMIKAYQANPDYDNWRKIVSDTENVPDFRTRHWTRIGGYGDFATVAEKGTYPTITSPGDEEVTYSVSKYGGIDDISLEMILGDRLGQVRRLPMLMANAAIRTLYKFVIALATTTNPTMGYDTTALYHANHANTGTTALSVAGLDAVNVAMRSQTAYGQSSEILGTRNKPRYLIIPNTLESLAQRVINPSDAYLAAISNPGTDTTMDPARWKGQGVEAIVYDQFTDTNDWFTVADPTKTPTMVVGFLNGNQSPELFTQDQPNVGAVFTADKVSYKLRFIFGGVIEDHRAFYRQVV